jgi:hypothetical protein
VSLAAVDVKSLHAKTGADMVLTNIFDPLREVKGISAAITPRASSPRSRRDRPDEGRFVHAAQTRFVTGRVLFVRRDDRIRDGPTVVLARCSSVQ